jgi:hypothetical protein
MNTFTNCDTEFCSQPIVYTGFTIWAIGCGCLSTITNHTHKPVLVWFMLMAGTGAGGVSACVPKPRCRD